MERGRGDRIPPLMILIIATERSLFLLPVNDVNESSIIKLIFQKEKKNVRTKCFIFLFSFFFLFWWG